MLHILEMKNEYTKHLSNEISAFLKGELMFKKSKKKIISIFMIIIIFIIIVATITVITRYKNAKAEVEVTSVQKNQINQI